MQQAFTYTCHITFMRLQNTLVPWIISFTRVDANLETIVIHTSIEDLEFTHGDVLYNHQNVNFYPKPLNFTSDRVVSLDELETGYLERFVIDELTMQGESPRIAAVDKETFFFLLKELPHVFLRCLPSDIEDRTFATAYRHSVKKIGNEAHYLYTAHCSFIQHNNKKIPWHLCLTSTADPSMTFVFGLKTDDLKFNSEDLQFNEVKVENFPRSPETKLDFDPPLDRFDDVLKNVFQTQLFKDGWFATVATCDEPTYYYLIQHIPPNNIMLISSKSDSENKSFAVAYRLLKENPFYSPPPDY